MRRHAAAETTASAPPPPAAQPAVDYESLRRSTLASARKAKRSAGLTRFDLARAGHRTQRQLDDGRDPQRAGRGRADLPVPTRWRRDRLRGEPVSRGPLPQQHARSCSSRDRSASTPATASSARACRSRSAPASARRYRSRSSRASWSPRGRAYSRRATCSCCASCAACSRSRRFARTTTSGRSRRRAGPRHVHGAGAPPQGGLELRAQDKPQGTEALPDGYLVPVGCRQEAGEEASVTLIEQTPSHDHTQHLGRPRAGVCSRSSWSRRRT